MNGESLLRGQVYVTSNYLCTEFVNWKPKTFFNYPARGTFYNDEHNMTS